jgi:molybdopterin converting factor small subunit
VTSSSATAGPRWRSRPLAVLRLFAAARDAAGTGRDTVDAATVGDALDAARARYGARFSEVLAGSRVWLNGEPADPSTPVGDRDEVAVLPPVSGGAP